MSKIVLKGKLFKWEGPSAWYFLSSTKAQGEEIRKHVKSTKGWRSVPVSVSIGKTKFKTSLFPTKEGPFLMPVKASVRKAEGLEDKDPVTATCVYL